MHKSQLMLDDTTSSAPVDVCRPLMSVPHILADESSAYYHAYVLAEMSVHQTRAHFKQKYGQLVDNDQVSYLPHWYAASDALSMEQSNWLTPR